MTCRRPDLNRLYRGAAAVLALLCLLLAQCSKPGSRLPDEALMRSISLVPEKIHPLVAAYTGGITAAGDDIRLQLTDDPIRLQAEPGTELDIEVFRFSPEVKGHTVFEDARTLVFRPSQPLRHGTVYNVTAFISRLADTKGMPDEFTYSLMTLPLQVSVGKSSWRTDEASDGTFSISRQITLSDAVDAGPVEASLTAVLDGGPVRTEWTHDTSGLRHEVRLSGIRPGGNLQLDWNFKPLDIKYTEREKMQAPRADVWQVTDIAVQYMPDFCIVATFPAPLDDRTDVAGHFTLNRSESPRCVVKGNTVLIYPPAQEAGDLVLTVHAGLRDTQGRKLQETSDHTLHIDGLTPQVEFVKTGFILPDTGRVVLPVRSVNYTGLDVRIGRLSAENLPYYLMDNDIEEDYSMYRAQETVGETHIVLGSPDDPTLRSWHNYALDLTDLIAREPGAVYRIYLRGTQPLCEETSSWSGDGYLFGPYDTRKARIRTLMVTNLGLMAKGDEQLHYQFTVSDLKTTRPVPQVTITVFDSRHRALAAGRTGRDGTWSTTLTDVPALAMASDGQQTGFLKLTTGESLQVSNFDVAGTAASTGLNGMIYGERGVWRPGDSLFLTFVLMDPDRTLPPMHPVTMQLFNPLGQEVGRQVKVRDEHGMYSFRWGTDDQAPTGRWRAQVSVGGSTFSRSLPVESIKANRLRIVCQSDASVLTPQAHIRIEAAHLTGQPASDLPVRADLTLTSSPTTFTGYKGFVFDDPAKFFLTENQAVFEGRLDAEGQAAFNVTPGSLHQAPGMLRGRFSVSVAEESGNLNSTVYTWPFAPYRTFVGLKAASLQAQEDTRDMLRWKVRESIPVEVAAVNSQGQPDTGTEQVQIEVYRVNWSWWWDISEKKGPADYLQDIREDLIRTETVQLQQGKGHIDLYFNAEQSGIYFIRALHPDGHSCGLTADVNTYAWIDESRADGATRLDIASDKTRYTAGETAWFEATAPDGAEAVVSVENGRKQLASFRVEASRGKVRFPLELTAAMAPNCYVWISLLQPHLHTGNDLPVRMYGVIPVLVDDPATLLHPVISTVREVRPEKPFEVVVSEQNGRPMSYTLAVVDEGLWGLTRFSAPDLHAFFYARQALGVRTWDMYDKVMGAYGGRIEQLFAIGGDNEIQPGDLSGQLQRFTAVAQHFGPFTIQAGRQGRHTVNLPPYMGRIHVMVVASDGTAFGSTTTDVTVKQPLMVQATLPRILAPEEEVMLPVTVFSNSVDIKSVHLELQTGGQLSATGGLTKDITFADPGEQTVSFRLRTTGCGAGHIRVVAQSGREQAGDAIQIEVRNPNQRRYASFFKEIPPQSDLEGSVQLPGGAGTNQMSVTLSTLPPLQLERRLEWLTAYPHGCLEQLVSKALPQLYLDGLAELTENRRSTVSQHAASALARLRQYQTASGGFAYWPGGTEPHAWGTSYAGLFLLEAERCGYALPTGVKEAWLTFQQARAKAWRSDGTEPDVIQGFRLYSLASAHAANLSAMNRLKDTPGISLQTQWLLAACYQTAGQTAVADALLTALPRQTDRSRSDEITFGSPDRDEALLTEVLTLLDRREEAFAAVRHLSERLSSDDWMDTQATAWALKAVARCLSHFGFKAVPVQAVFQSDAPSAGWMVAETEATAVTRTVSPGQAVGTYPFSIHNASDSPLFAVVTASGIPDTGTTPAYRQHIGLDVTFEDMDGLPLDVTSLPLHKQFVMVTTVRHLSPQLGTFRHLALTSMLPSGWEILNDRLSDTDEQDMPGEDYRDIRDDRVCCYFDLEPGSFKVFRTTLSASYAGTFHYPAATCEAMYNTDVRAATAGFTCTVEQ